jgi:glycogen phosphorylase
MINADSNNSQLMLKRAINYHLKCSLCKERGTREIQSLFSSTALALRDIMIEIMLETEKKYKREKSKKVYYLSMEFLPGRLLASNLLSLNMFEVCKNILRDRGVDIENIIEQEKDIGLGNGGLGRLASCFLDSMATRHIPGFGYGINYEYGLFKQIVDDGYQKESPDNWLAESSPWEIKRPDEKLLVPVYGRIEHGTDRAGNYNPMWLDWKIIIGIPYDIPIVGYGGKTVNWLRLYSAGPSSEFDIQIFNEGDYFRAVEQKIYTETITKILYPSDTFKTGKELRLTQEYFLTACSLRDILRRFLKDYNDLSILPEKVAIQMNDTHPSLAVAELMRILVDENDMPWENAWDITKKTLSYTNHTILPEALEKWPVKLMESIIPRHLQIIYEINSRFLQEVSSRWSGNSEKVHHMSFVEEGEEKRIRMAHLAVAGSHSINGVSSLHTKLLKKDLFSNFHALWPERFVNVTNGITQRRWLLQSNRLLAQLINDTIGDRWITDLYHLKELEKYADNKSFQKTFMDIKRVNKERLANLVRNSGSVVLNPDSLFDVHAKRIHEYKRQSLKIMHIIYEYLKIVRGEKKPLISKTFIFSGKAAPGYYLAKLIIKLIHSVAQVINNDPALTNILKVAFIPDYKVSIAEKLIPAADLSEQISTAGTEASGTGNMKFALNGALTVSTLDGAVIEMIEEIGEDNFFIFGLKSDEILEMEQNNSYNPSSYYDKYPEIQIVMDSLRDNFFCADEPGIFHPIYERILSNDDKYFHLHDFISYIEIQNKIEEIYLDKNKWAQKAILNVARMGKFSSDRSISEYADHIWHVKPLPDNIERLKKKGTSKEYV